MKMKNTLILVLFPLFVIGVFGAVELKSVSVKEGDSVTLHTGFQIKGSDEVEWWLKGKLIFIISSSAGEISVSDETDGAFRDRLKVDKLTGDLKITNFRNTDFGEYLLKIISSTRGSSEKTFSVTGESDPDPVKSVTEGESITLKTQKQSGDVIWWKFKAENTSMPKINLMVDRNTVDYDVLDGIFRDRLKLDHQNGSLTITNITDTHSGVYEADISNVNRYTILRTFTVTVEGKLVLVMEGDSVTLHTGTTKIQREDAVLWFGDQALITPSTGSVGPRWKNTDQDHQTGDLTIRNIRRDQSGDYKVKIIKSSITTVPRKFHINITGVFSSETDGVKTVTVNNGESVLLNTVTEIQQADLMEWLFGPQNIIIAKTDGKSNRPSYTNNDVRFENRLNLDIQTGSLTIENSNSEDSGLYQLKIINSTFTIQKRFRVSVSDSGPPPGVIAGIVSLIVLFAAVGGGVKFYRWKKSKAKQRKMKENPSQLPMLAGEPQ